MFSWFGKKTKRKRKPKKEKKGGFFDGVMKSVKKTNRRKLRSSVRTQGVTKVINRSGWYQSFLKSKLFNVALMMVVVYMVYLTGKEALVNYYQTKQLIKIEADNKKISQKNEELKYLLEYYKTDTYADLEARKHLNLKKKGEEVMVIPVDMNEFVLVDDAKKEEIKYRPNYQKWWDFVFADISKLPSGDESDV